MENPKSVRLMFPSPQFLLQPDNIGERRYGNVQNRMVVSPVHRPEFAVLVAVPTGLFTIMRDVIRAKPEITYSLTLDGNGDRFILSVVPHGESDFWDLWDYSERSLPSWILNSAYRLKMKG